MHKKKITLIGFLLASMIFLNINASAQNAIWRKSKCEYWYKGEKVDLEQYKSNEVAIKLKKEISGSKGNLFAYDYGIEKKGWANYAIGLFF